MVQYIARSCTHAWAHAYVSLAHGKTLDECHNGRFFLCALNYITLNHTRIFPHAFYLTMRMNQTHHDFWALIRAVISLIFRCFGWTFPQTKLWECIEFCLRILRRLFASARQMMVVKWIVIWHTHTQHEHTHNSQTHAPTQTHTHTQLTNTHAHTHTHTHMHTCTYIHTNTHNTHTWRL